MTTLSQEAERIKHLESRLKAAEKMAVALKLRKEYTGHNCRMFNKVGSCEHVSLWKVEMEEDKALQAWREGENAIHTTACQYPEGHECTCKP